MQFLQKISETEMELMEVIWDCEHQITSNELLHIFAQRGKEWKPQTISTFLSRLVEKKFLIATKQGRSNTYLPRISQEDYALWETESVLDKIYQGSVKNMITALYDGEKLSDDDIAELKQWFSER
ncbi:BlaI/MecI/CopY family transcriptional regulator [Sporosarcina sp. PTS2304]|uniref:BlaI/MecI/CopY family transcriptional regulator n=1 Tax=Sporosarcina sp. PTS2304 TaxID=2283194 RepID=UPI000E0D1794|nr:BlaI/MecI/CopY family transcriptional regulator [Sporosarcina sp. PTS2304]AXH99751.1 BlaI/MecI/CopY family transcriptional regulator [Sporosarcina sp. PTS2304]